MSHCDFSCMNSWLALEALGDKVACQHAAVSPSREQHFFFSHRHIQPTDREGVRPGACALRSRRGFCFVPDANLVPPVVPWPRKVTADAEVARRLVLATTTMGTSPALWYRITAVQRSCVLHRHFACPFISNI